VSGACINHRIRRMKKTKVKQDCRFFYLAPKLCSVCGRTTGFNFWRGALERFWEKVDDFRYFSGRRIPPV
jgi:hypothetical protein